jgi:hypothetical protein
VVLLLAGAAYLFTAARHVLSGDNGEFAALAVTGGVAHPPGYPLYVLYLRCLSWLPAAEPAHRAALATALLGAGTIYLFQRAAVAWGASSLAAALASFWYASSSLAWQLSSHAEVFTLNALLSAAIVHGAAPDSAASPRRRALLLGLLCGLGAANHHTIVFLAPLLLWAGLRCVRAGGGLAVVSGLLGVAVGLLPYAYTALCARHPEGRWVWGDASDPGGLLHLVLRRDYGTFRLASRAQERQPLAQMAALCWHLLRDLNYTPLLCVPALVLGVRGLVRQGRSRIGAAAPPLLLGLCFLGAGPFFVALFNLPLAGIARHVIERFYLLPQLLLCLIVALAVDALLRLPRARPALWAGGALLLSALAVPGAYRAVQRHHGPMLDRYLRDTLELVPQGAVLIGSGDHRVFGFLYAREALRLRRDVVYVDKALLSFPWYRRYVGGLLGLALPALPEDGMERQRAVVAALLAAGRPVFLTDMADPRIMRAFPIYPIGTVLRAALPGAPPPDIAAIEQMNLALGPRLGIEPAQDIDVDSWDAGMHWEYARPWFMLARAYAGKGQPDKAAACRARGLRIMPWYERISGQRQGGG